MVLVLTKPLHCACIIYSVAMTDIRWDNGWATCTTRAVFYTKYKTSRRWVVKRHISSRIYLYTRPHTLIFLPASRRQCALPSLRHPSATTQWYRLLMFAAYGLRRTPYYALSMGMTPQFFRFWSMVTLTFDLWPWHSNSGEIFVHCT